MADSLKTGAAALLAFQRAIATTSHNIANSATAGYTRQNVDFQASPSIQRTYGHTGQGVEIGEIRRMEDKFAEAQLTQTGSELARLTALNNYSSQIDSLFADSNMTLTPALNSFFASLSNATNNPTDPTGRANVLTNAENLTRNFGSLYEGLDSVKRQMTKDLSSAIGEINALTEQISDLNESIVAASSNSGGRAPSDLLDQRNRLLSDLSDQVGIHTIDTANGGLDIYVANGQSLLTGNTFRELRIMPGAAGSAKVPIGLVSDNNIQMIGDQLSGGKIGGLVEFSHTVLTPSTNELGRMAFVLSDAINAQHALGIDATGAYVQSLFNQPPVYTTASAINTGTAAVVAEVTDASQMTSSEYSVDFDGINYSLTRLSDNSSISGGTILTMDGLTINVSGNMAAGDSFSISPARYAARDISTALTSEKQLALGSPLRTDSALYNAGNASAVITGISNPSDPNFNSAVNIVFNDPPDTFDLMERDTGTVLSAGISYNQNDEVTLNGWTATLSGDASAGDTYTVEQNVGGVGSNDNGLRMTEIQSRLLVENTSSLADAYGSLISNVGTRTRQTELTRDSMQGMHDSVQERRENTSGVNLDEEAINLTRYQQAYQAAAQVINTADQMFQTLIGAIR